MKINYLDENIEIKGIFGKKAVSYSDIERVYLRIEEVEAKICCGRANFDRSFLMVKTASDLYKVEMENADLVKSAMNKIKEKNEKIEIGKVS